MRQSSPSCDRSGKTTFNGCKDTFDSHKVLNFCSKGFRKINEIWEDFNCGYHANNYLVLHCIALLRLVIWIKRMNNNTLKDIWVYVRFISTTKKHFSKHSKQLFSPVSICPFSTFPC